jgi:hypothetical protein
MLNAVAPSKGSLEVTGFYDEKLIAAVKSFIVQAPEFISGMGIML